MKKQIISLILGGIVLSGCQFTGTKPPVKEMIPYLALGTTPSVTTTPTPVVTETVTPSISASPTQSVASSSGEEKELFKVGNIYGCSLTDKAEFTLDKNYLVTKMITWYTWKANESEVSYELLGGGKVIVSGKLTRDACDPYQTQWCGAVTKDFNTDLPKGDYILKLSSGRICQNSQSKGKGFITVTGK